MESDPTRMCALLVGLPDVIVNGVGGRPKWLRIEITSRAERPLCACGKQAHRHGIREVVLVDLACFGRATRLVWRKQRWRCPACRRSWTGQDPTIASSRCAMTTRAARWATVQVGRHGRAVSEGADDLGCDWHTVMDAVVVFGEPLIDDPARFEAVSAVGLDETLYVREGRYRRQLWSTRIVDVQRGQLLDVVPGREVANCCAWFAARPQAWCDAVRWATLDLSNSYRTVFDTMLPLAVQVADPFHVVRLASTALDECRRRVQNDIVGHRGRKDDPLYRARRRLTMAAERLSIDGRERLMGCSPLVTRRVRCGSRGTRKRSSARSTTTPTSSSPPPGWPRSAVTSLTSRCPSRSAAWAAPSASGRHRSLRGTSRTSRTGPPKRSTTSSNA